MLQTNGNQVLLDYCTATHSFCSKGQFSSLP